MKLIVVLLLGIIPLADRIEYAKAVFLRDKVNAELKKMGMPQNSRVPRKDKFVPRSVREG